jgi:hypothetical protein
MLDAPRNTNATLGSPVSLLTLLVPGNPLLLPKSHGEWDKKTTQAGANQEKLCFD